MPPDKPKDYAVGYGKPPASGRFAKGRSGNPSGRRRNSKNFATVIQAELLARVPVTENGKSKSITKREAVAKQLVNKAAAGDPRAIPILLNEARPHETDVSNDAEGPAPFAAEDQMVIERIAQRIRNATPGDSAANGKVAPDPQTTKNDGAVDEEPQP